jgi:hypothetical protein
MSLARCSSRLGQIIALAEVLADSASFISAVEVSDALAGLGYDVDYLADAEVAAEIDQRCANALMLMSMPPDCRPRVV